MDDQQTEKKTGKLYGSIAFFIYEFLIVSGMIFCFVTALLGNEFSTNLFVSCLTAQGVVFATVWGTKAYKNKLDSQAKIE